MKVNQKRVLGSVYIEITNKCNLYCKHCYNNSMIVNRAFMDKKTIERLFKDLAHQEKVVSISGGEPLLHPDIDDIIHLGKIYNVHVNLITNGTLISEHIDALIANDLISVQISIDGNSASHNALRGEGTYEKSILNISSLNTNNIKWSLKCTINKYNVHDMDEIIAFALNNNATAVGFSIINQQGRTCKNDISLLANEIISVCDKLAELKNKYQSRLDMHIPKIKSNNLCPWLDTTTTQLSISPRIDVFGNVYLCQMFNNTMFSLGNVYTDELKHIIESERTQTVLDFLRNYNSLNSCSCFLSSVCRKGCPAMYMNNLPEYYDEGCRARKINMFTAICKND